MFGAFPKIFHLGAFQIEHLFDGMVEITEKVDGSQFAFGFDEKGDFRMRSKGAEIQVGAPPALFKGAHDMALNARERCGFTMERMVFYGEALQKPKHNTLTYDRVPKNNFALFGAVIDTGEWASHEELGAWADCLDCDVVPVIAQAEFAQGLTESQLRELLDRESFLGGPKIEGIVVKNLARAVDWKGLFLPVTCGKFVSEAFKEVNDKTWSKENTAKGKFGALLEQYRTEARWMKAVEHLRDAEKLEFSPRDIGMLIGEIRRDVWDEEKEAIKNKLWQIYGDDVLRASIRGFPEWYKLKLMEGTFR